MGVVYWARDPRLGRLVALKTMSSSVAGDPELLQRFYREAQSAGQLRHPNIVTIYDIGKADGIPFIAMEFLEGESLEQIIAARKEVLVVKKVDVDVHVARAGSWPGGGRPLRHLQRRGHSLGFFLRRPCWPTWASLTPSASQSAKSGVYQGLVP